MQKHKAILMEQTHMDVTGGLTFLQFCYKPCNLLAETMQLQSPDHSETSPWQHIQHIAYMFPGMDKASSH